MAKELSVPSEAVSLSLGSIPLPPESVPLSPTEFQISSLHLDTNAEEDAHKNDCIVEEPRDSIAHSSAKLKDIGKESSISDYPQLLLTHTLHDELNRTEVFEQSKISSDGIPPLETEKQFRRAVGRCARGGDSVERGSNERDKENNVALDHHVNGCQKKVERTRAEREAFFFRLSRPKVSTDCCSKEHCKELYSADHGVAAITKGVSFSSITATQGSQHRRIGGHSAAIGLRAPVRRTRSKSSAD